MIRIRTLLGTPALAVPFLFVPGGSAWAGLVDVSFGAGGTILAAPAWRDAIGNEISTLSFAFTGTSGAVSAVDVDSIAFAARLTDAPLYPALIAVTLPSGCSIGSTPVADAHLRLLVGGVEATALFTVFSNANQDYGLRFAAAGGYGTATGNVTCSQAGKYRYSY